VPMYGMVSMHVGGSDRAGSISKTLLPNHTGDISRIHM
jgi:hypothetical protein